MSVDADLKYGRERKREKPVEMHVPYLRHVDDNLIVTKSGFLVGVVQTGISLLRLGDLSRYVSHAVIVGFTVGASVLLVLDQLKNLLGLPPAGSGEDHFLVRVWLTMALSVLPARGGMGPFTGWMIPALEARVRWTRGIVLQILFLLAFKRAPRRLAKFGHGHRVADASALGLLRR